MLSLSGSLEGRKTSLDSEVSFEEGAGVFGAGTSFGGAEAFFGEETSVKEEEISFGVEASFTGGEASFRREEASCGDLTLDEGTTSFGSFGEETSWETEEVSFKEASTSFGGSRCKGTDSWPKLLPSGTELPGARAPAGAFAVE